MSQFFFDEQGNVRTNLTHDADHEKIEYFLGQLQSVHPNSRATLELDRLEVALRNGDFVDSDATEDWDDLQNKSEERRYIADQTAQFVSVFKEEFGHYPQPELSDRI